jgi:transcriptional regulator GlxA family with amidase domain
MLENHGKPITVGDIADYVGLSKFHFVRVFSRLAGISPGALLRRMRIVRAARLLEESSLSVSEVGMAVGYCYATAFARAFRGVLGTSPSSYRVRTSSS